MKILKKILLGLTFIVISPILFIIAMGEILQMIGESYKDWLFDIKRKW